LKKKNTRQNEEREREREREREKEREVGHSSANLKATTLTLLFVGDEVQ